jgi:hypothetical protein
LEKGVVEITHCVAMPFDFSDGELVAGDQIKCPTPVAAILQAEGLWKVFHHAGAVAFSRTSDFATGKYNDVHVFRRFGLVPNDF